MLIHTAVMVCNSQLCAMTDVKVFRVVKISTFKTECLCYPIQQFMAT